MEGSQVVCKDSQCSHVLSRFRLLCSSRRFMYVLLRTRDWVNYHKIYFHQIGVCFKVPKINHSELNSGSLNQYWLLSCDVPNAFFPPAAHRSAAHEGFRDNMPHTPCRLADLWTFPQLCWYINWYSLKQVLCGNYVVESSWAQHSGHVQKTLSHSIVLVLWLLQSLHHLFLWFSES